MPIMRFLVGVAVLATTIVIFALYAHHSLARGDVLPIRVLNMETAWGNAPDKKLTPAEQVVADFNRSQPLKTNKEPPQERVEIWRMIDDENRMRATLSFKLTGVGSGNLKLTLPFPAPK